MVIVLVEVVVVVDIPYEMLTDTELETNGGMLVVVTSTDVVDWLGTGSEFGGWVGAPENDGSACGYTNVSIKRLSLKTRHGNLR